jgi:sporulation protein YlmC with PRC-barrel domain
MEGKMRLSKELIGKPIFSITDGRELGTVKDLYLDTELEALIGFYLGSEGLFSRKERVVMREAITILGVDALLSVGPDVVTNSNEFPKVKGWLRREDILGRAIETPGGTKVGTVGDLQLDEEGNIVGFSLSRVNVEGPIKENKTILVAALVEAGGKDGTMKVDLAKAEGQADDVAEPEAPAEPIEPVKLDESSDLNDLAESVKPSEPAEPVEPDESSES